MHQENARQNARNPLTRPKSPTFGHKQHWQTRSATHRRRPTPDRTRYLAHKPYRKKAIKQPTEIRAWKEGGRRRPGGRLERSARRASSCPCPCPCSRRSSPSAAPSLPSPTSSSSPPRGFFPLEGGSDGSKMERRDLGGGQRECDEGVRGVVSGRARGRRQRSTQRTLGCYEALCGRWPGS